jgi:hypothetical protein
MMRSLTKIVIITAIASAGACGDSLYCPAFSVVADGSGSAVAEGELWSTCAVQPGGDDNLYVSAGGATLDLDGPVVFEIDDGGTEFTFSLSRGDDAEDAPSSTVTLPEGFTLSGIEEGSEVSRAGGVDLTWREDDAGDGMRWRVSGACLVKAGDRFPDTGSLALDDGDVRALVGAEDESCEAELCVERRRGGRLDPFFDGIGTIYAAQERCVGFTSVP